MIQDNSCLSNLDKESNWSPVAHEIVTWALSLFQYLAGAQATGWCFCKWRILGELQDEALCEKTACKWKIWKVILFWTSLKEHSYGLKGKKPQCFGQYMVSFAIVCENKDSKFSLPIFSLFVLPWIYCFLKQNCAKSSPQWVLNVLQEGQGFIPSLTMTLQRRIVAVDLIPHQEAAIWPK